MRFTIVRVNCTVLPNISIMGEGLEIREKSKEPKIYLSKIGRQYKTI
jgi:hypothetical protein